MLMKNVSVRYAEGYWRNRDLYGFVRSYDFGRHSCRASGVPLTFTLNVRPEVLATFRRAQVASRKLEAIDRAVKQPEIALKLLHS